MSDVTASHWGLHARPTQPTSEAIDDFQSGVGHWMLACFGPEVSADRLERADRFTEEALELAQTMPGFTAERAHALVDYVFGRPVGERNQEVGGVMVTLAALCNSFELDIATEAHRELARVWTKVEEIRAKRASKPVGSALPVATQADPREVEIERLREILFDWTEAKEDLRALECANDTTSKFDRALARYHNAEERARTVLASPERKA
jgi:NTP pyrophosphatase (non-canonical NTP hydrolase)